MKRLLAAAFAGAISLLFLGYGGLILLSLPSAHSPMPFTAILVPLFSTIYGALTGWLLVTAWVKPTSQYDKWSLQLAVVMFLLWAGWNIRAAFAAGSVKQLLFLGTIAIALLLAAHVGCIRFVGTAQQGAPGDRSRPAGSARG